MAKKILTIDGKTLIVTDEKTQSFSGTVVITDPCYFIPDDVWQTLCHDVWFEGKVGTEFADAGTIYYEGAKILYSSTAHGDGCYAVEDCTDILHDEFGVDAGTMCVLTLLDFEKFSDDDPEPGTHAVIEDFSGTVQADGNGNLVGDFNVWTDGVNREEERSSWDGDWDDDDDYNESDNDYDRNDWSDEYED